MAMSSGTIDSTDSAADGADPACRLLAMLSASLSSKVEACDGVGCEFLLLDLCAALWAEALGAPLGTVVFLRLRWLPLRALLAALFTEEPALDDAEKLSIISLAMLWFSWVTSCNVAGVASLTTLSYLSRQSR